MLVAHVNATAAVSATALLGAMSVAAAWVISKRAVPALLVGVAVAACAFQLLHTAEHLLQVVHWSARPAHTPWLSGWAAAGRDGLGGLVAGQLGTATELLHLVGNTVFFLGLAAGREAVHLLDGSDCPWLRRSLWLQGAHVAEHVLLTATVILTGTATGLTTLFGLLPSGILPAISVRVLLHFSVNALVTVWALGAVLEVVDAVVRRRAQVHPAVT